MTFCEGCGEMKRRVVTVTWWAYGVPQLRTDFCNECREEWGFAL